jgi:uncharacterized repeat protein (TIGR04042 family)
MRFLIRWPDGKSESCYSPSLVVKDFFAPGQSYPLADFLERSRAAFAIASERVQARYGFPCSRAMAQLDRIEIGAKAFADLVDARVNVDAFEE